jgi:Putative peptidoglycan binding domain
MNLNRTLFLSCFAAVILSASLAFADNHGRHITSSSSRPAIARSAQRSAPITRSSSGTFRRWNGNWNSANRSLSRANGNWNGNWRHRHFGNRIVFLGGFGYPFYPYYGGYYPYDYYSSGYPYGYDPYGYSSYNQVYQGGTVYGDDSAYSDDAAYNNGAGYYNNGGAYRGGRTNGSMVAQVQRALARDGFYKGEIDGVMGPRTYYAIRAYERSHNLRVDGAINDQLLGTMGLR